MAFARTDPEHICLDKTDRLSRVRGDDAVYSEPAVVMEKGADKMRVKRDRGERERETRYSPRCREIEIERSNKAPGAMPSSSSSGTENAAFAFGFLYEKRATSPDGGLSK